MSVKSVTATRRPRERLLRFGSSSLSNIELWMCVLGIGRVGLPVEELAKKVSQWASLQTPNNQTTSSPLPHEITASQRARVLAVWELCHRWVRRQAVPVTSVTPVLLLCHDLRLARQEKVVALFCGSDGQVLSREVIAVGGLNVTHVTPKDIFFHLRFQPVDSIVVCHNHPSGDPSPSHQDIVFTKRLEAAAQLVGVWLRDHVIISREAHYSFRAHGLLQEIPGLTSA